MNYLCGVEPLDEWIKVDFLKRFFRYAYQKQSDEWDDEPGEFDECETMSCLEQIFKDAGGDFPNIMLNLALFFPDKLSKEKLSCDTLWSLMEKVGASNVRFIGYVEQTRGDIFGQEMPHYNPLSHTLYITPDLLKVGRFIHAEAAHALQFERAPLQAYPEAVFMAIHTALIM